MITGPGRIVQWFDAEGRPIEIGQKRENMKKFNLEEALQGKPVVTRDGRKVGQLTYFRGTEGVYPVFGVVGDVLKRYTKNGKFWNDNFGQHYEDLFMESAKREGWVNIYDTGRSPRAGGVHMSDFAKQGVHSSQSIYTCKEAAEQAAEAGLIATVRIEWEE